MLAHIRGGIRMFRALQKAQLHGVVLDAVAVFAVVQQADAVAGFGKIRPFVAAHPQTVPNPSCCSSGGTLRMAELNIIGGLCGTDVGVEGSLQQTVILMPVRVGLKVNPLESLYTIISCVISDFRYL